MQTRPLLSRAHDLLGIQLAITHYWRISNFNPAEIYTDEVTGETVPANILFLDIGGGRYSMRTDSIPGDLGLKAIGVDKKGIYLETAPVDGIKIDAACTRSKLQPNARKRSVFWGGEAILSFSTAMTPTGLRPRMLWTIAVNSDSGIHTAINFLDQMYSEGDFFEPEEEEEDSGNSHAVSTPQLSLRMSQSFQQKLHVEQKPGLMLKLGIGMRPMASQTMQLQALHWFGRQITTALDSADPEAEMTKLIVEHGSEKILRGAIWAIAGRIKSAHPEISWRTARQAARKVVLGHP